MAERQSVLARFGLASFSAACVSASHLLLQLVAVRIMTATEIGTLAFLLVIIQFGFSLSNALICTPFTVNLNRADGDEQSFGFLFRMNLMLALAQGALCASIASVMAGASTAFVFAIAGMISLIRWFGRADAYARHMPRRAAYSDFLYSTVLVLALAAAWKTGFSLTFTGAALAIAGLVSLAPFGIAFLRKHAPIGMGAAWTAYRPVWREQSSWTLLGVVSTEATSNSHPYIVTALVGPTAFAPVAVAQLFFRPVNVCITALTQLERPRMARALALGDDTTAKRSALHFGFALLAVWCLTLAAAALVLWHFPQFVLKPGWSLEALVLGVGLCGLLLLAQCIQAPLSVLTQARGAFKPLALASVYSSAFGLLIVTILVTFAGPVWSIAGVVLAQIVLLALIRNIDRAWNLGRQAEANLA
jgi:O-antigen/teichoic acid export membrane protein